MGKRSPTEQQARIVGSRGHVAIRACPGSGKTFTVAAHLHHLFSSWTVPNAGIAAVSFTNVAWQEIRDYLEDDFGLAGPAGYPHFLGTIDSFTNQNIFLRFGHLLTQNRAVRLTGPPFDNLSPEEKWLPWGQRACYERGCQLNDFSYDANGRVIHTRDDRTATCSVTGKPCITNKGRFTRLGRATQPDANFLSLDILRRYPVVGRILARRYPVLVVDEAQDSSDIQMAILDMLISSGVQDALFVGDPDQAIYEWRRATPQLFVDKVKAWGGPQVLTQNWRSSEAICNAVSRVSTLPQPMEACNPDVKDTRTSPEVWAYEDEEELIELRGKFIELTEKQGIPQSGIALLARSRDLVRLLEGSDAPADLAPWNDLHSRFFAYGRFLYDNRSYPEAFAMVQRGILRALGEWHPDNVQLRQVQERVGLVAWRTFCHRVLLALPATDCALGDWIAAANVSLPTIAELADCRLSAKRKSPKCDYPRTLVATFFQKPPGSVVRCDTVHGVKGATFEAVMLVLKHKAGSARYYKTLLADRAFSDEEMRTVYVGLTRPRRLLVLCVPLADQDPWIAALGLAGVRD